MTPAALRLRPRWEVLDRPVFVIACPRSGSTLVFRLLAGHPHLWSWLGEAHEVWDVLPPPDHPAALGDSWPESYGGKETGRVASRLLLKGAVERRRRAGLPTGRAAALGLRRVRFVEKTPKNALRVGSLAAMFPDARFVFLHRHGPANVASLVEAWAEMDQGRARVGTSTGRQVTWSLARPAGWEELVDEPVPVKAAFQWVECNRAALAALERVDPSRVLRLPFESFLDDASGWAARLCRFAEVPMSPEVERYASALPVAPSTVSAPRPEKWRERLTELRPVLPMLEATMAALGYDPS